MEVEQGGGACVHLEQDIPAAAAVASVGTTQGLELLPVDRGAAVTSVAGLYAHLITGRWSSVISHAWLHMFGVPQGMRVVRLDDPPYSPRIGLVVAGHDPESMLARALVEIAREVDMRGELDRVLASYLR